MEDIKFIITKTMDAVKRKIDPNKRSGCFEIFGYDFMVDIDFTVWLIEVNTNPCLEESSDLLKRLLPIIYWLKYPIKKILLNIHSVLNVFKIC